MIVNAASSQSSPPNLMLGDVSPTVLQGPPRASLEPSASLNPQSTEHSTSMEQWLNYAQIINHKLCLHYN